MISASISQTVKNSRNVQISIFSAFCFKCRLLTQALTSRYTAVTARRQGPMTSFARLQYVPSATFLPPLPPIPPVLERENPTPRGSTRNACVRACYPFSWTCLTYVMVGVYRKDKSTSKHVYTLQATEELWKRYPLARIQNHPVIFFA